MRRRPVRVVWWDHYHSAPGEWQTLKGMPAPRPAECETIGFLIRRTKHVVVVAQTLTEGSDGTGVFVILRTCIKSMEAL